MEYIVYVCVTRTFGNQLRTSHTERVYQQLLPSAHLYVLVGFSLRALFIAENLKLLLHLYL